MFSEYQSTINSVASDVEPVEGLAVNQMSKANIRDKFENYDNLEVTLGKYIENPGMYLDKMESAYQMGQILKEKYPEDVDAYLATGLIINSSPFILTASAGMMNKCDTQFNTDVQFCKEVAMIAAVGCGLTAWTLGGALICGGAVIATRVACGKHALNSHANCISASQ